MTTAEVLRRLADELEQTGRARAEAGVGPCEDHEGLDCHAAAAFTAWSRAAAVARKRADELSSPLPVSENEPTAKDAGATLRLWHGSLHKVEESEYDHGYRVAYERIVDWLEHEFPAIWVAGNAPQQSGVTS